MKKAEKAVVIWTLIDQTLLMISSSVKNWLVNITKLVEIILNFKIIASISSIYLNFKYLGIITN